jgi:hypothetical protein
MRFLRASFAAALVLTGGCTGGGSLQCQAIPVAILAPPLMVAPAPGATGVPTTGTSVEISYNPPSGSLRVVAGDGTTIAGGPLTPAPSPPPAGVVSALPPLAPHTTYTVFVDANYGPAGPCPVGRTGPQSFNLGTFTTQ